MPIGLATAIVLPVGAGVVVIRHASPGLWRASRVLVIGIATIAALACSSLFFTLSVFAFGPRWPLYIPLEVAIWLIPLVAWAAAWRRGDALPAAGTSRMTAVEKIAAVVFGCVLGISLLHFLAWSAHSPSGEWDSWAIWNLRARFLDRGLDGHWRDGFMAALGWSSPEYPLLLPSSVARLWLYAGAESRVAPILVAALFTYAASGIVLGGLWGWGRRWQGLCAAAIVLSSRGFNVWAAAQIADVPLAAFVVASTILLSYIVGGRVLGSDSGTVGVLTFCATSAAWTKNEGIVFAGATLIVLGVILALHGRVIRTTVLAALAGLLLPAATLWYFKANISPGSPLFPAGTVAGTRLVDLDRHLYIAGSFLGELWSWNTTRPVGLLPFVAGYAVAACALNGFRRAQLLPGVPLLAMLSSYYAVYMVTPADLSWHIGTSLTRILVHVWPALVNIAFSLPAGEAGPRTPTT